MKTDIVITSIFNPTEAVIKFSKLNDYRLIVVGDKKTPEDWSYENVDYISVSQQDKLNFKLAKVLPYNHYCRKMLGYLKAMQNGANYIIDTDDDNIPKTNWSFPDFEAQYDCITRDEGFVNIYQLFTKQKIWPRGLPLKLINTQFELEKSIEVKKCNVGIWQGLADEDPDVDAIYRLTNDEPCYFEEREPVVCSQGVISPFNTQNTIIRKELFVLMYLPTYVTFRFTDILRGLVAQPIMWLYGYQLGFINATVVQKRNPHDYMKDFISEIPMYEYCEKVMELVSNSISKSESIETNLYNAYKALLKEGIICELEMKMVETWLQDIKSINKKK
ncbi:STELLO glycosyltransferase family protein [Flavobacterium eburneipallidum]|uniref:STELLO glycosyltransferase family protein n=1 Tax=Flavobacterium eburneipallidum TaxID=3003263 RepID=UPI0022AC4A4A|nr:STELLO glycosyltransferase family protein [Flavobacterium eburneipallidum]